MGSDDRIRGRHLILIAAGVTAGVAVIVASLYWPPPPGSEIHGLIGQRKVYRDSPLSDADVAKSRVRADSVEALADLLERSHLSKIFDEASARDFMTDFQQMLKNSAFQDLVRTNKLKALAEDAEFQDLIGNSEFLTLVAQAGSLDAVQRGNTEFEWLVDNHPSLLSLKEQPGLWTGQFRPLLRNRVFQQSVRHPAELLAFLDAEELKGLVDTPDLQGLLQSQTFSSLMGSNEPPPPPPPPPPPTSNP